MEKNHYKELITKQDIKAIKEKAKTGTITADESKLLLSADWSEFQIQSACYNLFKACGFGDNAIFLQIDNGGSAVEGVRKKKAATGTQSGWPDVEVKMWKHYTLTLAHHSIHIEFKKIGGKIAENQQKWHEFLKEKSESVYFCNNVLFFEKVILEEVKQFLAS